MAKKRPHSSPSAKSRAQHQVREPIYIPFDFVFVRAPLLPIESYWQINKADRTVGLDERLDLTATPEIAAVVASNPTIRRALAVGSLSLLNAMDRASSDSKKIRSVERKLRRFLIRMSTRPTPFGLFAGSALADWGPQTDLRLAAVPPHVRTRPDMEWLYRFISALESRQEVRTELHLVANSAALVRAGRIFLRQLPLMQRTDELQEVSVRATPVVLRALAAARQPIHYKKLATHLLATTPGATPEKIDGLLTELWRQTLLLTDLRPPLTTDSPVRHLSASLAAIPSAREDWEKLTAILDQAQSWSDDWSDASADRYRVMVGNARLLNGAVETTPFQVDMALPIAGRKINYEVGREAARAAELLMRLSPVEPGLPDLNAYRHAFLSRYGAEREVPLLELLDPEFGLGPMSGYRDHAGSEIPSAKFAMRAQTLAGLAAGALREKRLAVQLDAATIARLETWSPSADHPAPPSLDIYVTVAARSPAAIDAGEFQIVVGPNLGAWAAGRNLGRFADLLGIEVRDALAEVARAEETENPSCLWAELVYLPRHLRTANVVIRPATRTHEIVYGVAAGVSADKTIALDELVVGIRNGRFYVRWTVADKEIAVCSGHMLSTLQAPPVCRFLSDLSRDRVANLSSFGWGTASALPFLPRVEVGRVVLRPAEWKINATIRDHELPADSSSVFAQALERWRDRWLVPRWVYLSRGDNRLLLDLENAEQVEDFRDEVKKLEAEGRVDLQEVIPALDQMWLEGVGGHFASELVVSLLLRSTAGKLLNKNEREKNPNSAALRSGDYNAPSIRLRPPGSEWLFVKLYGPRSLEDDLIAFALREFVHEAVAKGMAVEWFFVRYADPDPHLRLRFRGTPDLLMRNLLPALSAWAAQLVATDVCARFCFDTYERELERYGGTSGMEMAEALFCADSRMVAELLTSRSWREPGFDRTVLAIVSVDDLLAGLGMSEEARVLWYSEQVSSPQQASPEFRKRNNLLRSLLSRPARECVQMLGADAVFTLAARRTALAPVAERLADITARGELDQPPRALYRSFVHMHLNRLLGRDRAAESRVLDWLRRSRRGLLSTPL